MPFVTAVRAAELLGVDRMTVRRWSDSGKLPVAHRTKGGHRRYMLEDVMRLAKATRWPFQVDDDTASGRDDDATTTSAAGAMKGSGVRGNLHPFVRRIAEFHDRASSYGAPIGVKGSGYVALRVPLELRERAYLLADVILKNAQARGHGVVASDGGVDVVVLGAEFTLVINTAMPKKASSPNARDLAFYFARQNSPVGRWRDGRSRLVEERVPEAIAALEAAAPAALPIPTEIAQRALALKLTREEERRMRARRRLRSVQRSKYIARIARELNQATMLQALVAHLNDGDAPPRVRQLREDALARANQLLEPLALAALEADLELRDLYDEVRGSEAAPDG